MLKKLIFIILLLLSSITLVNGLELTSYSKSAILYEPTTGTIIYDVNKDERLAPASMTKMMTMLIIMESLDSEKINLNDDVTISKNAASMGGSQVFLEENSKIQVEQLLKGIAIASGNDAAVAMAEYISGSTDQFVLEMNKKVKELGLKNTNFVNVHGLDADNHYSSAYDMAIIAGELLKHDKILEYTSLYEDYLIKPDGTKTWLVNTNKLVRFYEGVDGLKTGYTKEAMYCLASTAKKNDIRFIAVVMGNESSEKRSLDTTNMLNYGFANYKLNTIINKNDIVGEVRILKGKTNKALISVAEDVTDLISKGDNKEYSYNIDVNSTKAPVSKGDIVGNLEVIDNNGKLIKTVPVVVNENIEKHNFRSMFYEIYKNIISGYL